MRWDTTGVTTDPATLSDSERRRLDSLRREDDRRRFAAARTLLRATVAEATGADPGAVRVEQRCTRCGGAHGRPTVAVDGRRGVHVSIAHAGEVVMVAVADRPVGIDVEPMARSVGDLGPVVLAPAERARRSADDVDLLRTWVRKEAILKATGDGLLVEPSRLEVTAPDRPPALQRWDGRRRLPRVAMQDVDVPGHVGAVAALGRSQLVLDFSQAAPGGRLV